MRRTAFFLLLLALGPAAATTLTAREAGAGLVERRRDTHDGRGRVIALTARGREVIDAAFTEHIANEHRLLAMVGADRAGQLEEILRVWLAALEERPQPVLTLDYIVSGRSLSVFTTIATLGTPQDVTLQEVRIECFFPADDRSDALFKSLAARR